MDYYNYINQRQPSVHGRHLSSAGFTVSDAGVDSLSVAGGARYTDNCIPAHCGTGGHHHLDRSAVANGEVSRGRDSASYRQPFVTSESAQGVTSVDALRFCDPERTSTTVTVNDQHTEPNTSTSLQVHHRYLTPPQGTVLPPLDAGDDDAAATTEDNDDDGSASVGDGRSSASSARSSTSDYLNSTASAQCSDDTQREKKIGGKDLTMAVTSDKTSAINATEADLTSTQPLIYPWMRRVHSSSNGMNQHHLYAIPVCKSWHNNMRVQT